MKKVLLVATLLTAGIVSNVSAGSISDAWDDVVFTRLSHNHFVGATHMFDKDFPEDSGICIVGGQGAPDDDNVVTAMCDKTAIDLPAGTNILGFQVKSKQGLHLRYNMSKSQFEDAFRRANLQYTR